MSHNHSIEAEIHEEKMIGKTKLRNLNSYLESENNRRVIHLKCS